jgi:histidine triad (HIT) family protein
MQSRDPLLAKPSPFSLFLRGIEQEPVESRRSDIVHETRHALAIICSRQIPGHEGHVLVISKYQYANLFELPLDIGKEVFEVTQLVARAMLQAFACTGITVIQNNGAASDQTVFHYHVHLVPRFDGDNFLAKYAKHTETQQRMSPEARAELAERLRACLLSR